LLGRACVIVNPASDHIRHGISHRRRDWRRGETPHPLGSQWLILSSRPRFPEIDDAQVDDGPDDGVGDVDAEGNEEKKAGPIAICVAKF